MDPTAGTLGYWDKKLLARHADTRCSDCVEEVTAEIPRSQEKVWKWLPALFGLSN
jgi:hypothetical protein